MIIYSGKIKTVAHGLMNTIAVPKDAKHQYKSSHGQRAHSPSLAVCVQLSEELKGALYNNNQYI